MSLLSYLLLTVCPECGDKHETQSIEGGSPPRSGDFSICFNCGEITRYADDLSLRRLTLPEVRMITPEMRASAAQIVRRGRIRHRN
jgi:hypothetical protein